MGCYTMILTLSFLLPGWLGFTKKTGEFPGGSAVKTPCFQCRVRGFNSCPGSSHMPHSMAKNKWKHIALKIKRDADIKFKSDPWNISFWSTSESITERLTCRGPSPRPAVKESLPFWVPDPSTEEEQVTMRPVQLGMLVWRNSCPSCPHGRWESVSTEHFSSLWDQGQGPQRIPCVQAHEGTKDTPIQDLWMVTHCPRADITGAQGGQQRMGVGRSPSTPDPLLSH